DGPSAGVTMATALVSALSRRSERHDLAMTGEITLRGRVLPIGGVKEKLLGAVRAGIRTVVLPKENAADLEDLPEDVRSSLKVHLVEDLDEVLTLALRGARFEAGHLVFDGDVPVEPSLLAKHNLRSTSRFPSPRGISPGAFGFLVRNPSNPFRVRPV